MVASTCRDGLQGLYREPAWMFPFYVSCVLVISFCSLSEISVPSPMSHKVLSSAVSTMSRGTFLAFCVFESLHTIVNRPSINVSVSGVASFPDVLGFVPSILTTTSMEDDPVHVTNPLNLRSLYISSAICIYAHLTLSLFRRPNMSNLSALAVARYKPAREEASWKA